MNLCANPINSALIKLNVGANLHLCKCRSLIELFPTNRSERKQKKMCLSQAQLQFTRHGEAMNVCMVTC